MKKRSIYMLFAAANLLAVTFVHAANSLEQKIGEEGFRFIFKDKEDYMYWWKADPAKNKGGMMAVSILTTQYLRRNEVIPAYVKCEDNSLGFENDPPATGLKWLKLEQNDPHLEMVTIVCKGTNKKVASDQTNTTANKPLPGKENVWLYLKPKAGDKQRLFIAPETISSYGNNRRAWIVENKETNERTGALSTGSLVEYDCSEFKERLWMTVNYSGFTGTGKQTVVVNKLNYPAGSMLYEWENAFVRKNGEDTASLELSAACTMPLNSKIDPRAVEVPPLGVFKPVKRELDCSGPTNTVDMMVCQRPELRRLDAQLANITYQAMIKSDDPAKVDTDYREWLFGRKYDSRFRQNCGVSCMTDLYKMRIELMSVPR